MFKKEKLSEGNQRRYEYCIELYENDHHVACEMSNDYIVGNRNLDYLQGYRDALKVSKVRMIAVMKMWSITESCTKFFIRRAKEDIDNEIRMVNTWADRVIDDMEQKANLQKLICGATKSERPEIATDISNIFKERGE